MPSETPPTNGPRARQRVSRSGLELIKSFEGLRRKSARLPGGRYVVGYGHIRSAREGVEVSEADAEALLRYDLLPIEAAVNEWAFAPLTQNQFDALVSFAFNIGVKTFRRSDVLRRINEGAYLQAAGALEMWRRAELDGEGVIVDALVRRRAAEKALFLTPPGGHVAAPSAVLKPRIDFAAFRSVPRRRPEQVQTPLDGDEAVALRPAPETREEPETAWSPAKAAAANVSARLTEIVADEPDTAEAALDQGDLLDGDFMQAPPSPPEAHVASEEEDADDPDETFPELDLQPEPALAFAPEPDPDAVSAESPVVDLAELPPFPEDAELSPPGEPSDGFEDGYEPQAQATDGFDRTSGAFPTQGDPDALGRKVEGPDNGPYIYLFLAGLALFVAAAVIFFRTPEPGEAGGSGLGWVLGVLGGAMACGAIWAIKGREDALAADNDAEGSV